MHSISHARLCIFCGQTSCVSNSKDSSALATLTKRNQVIDLLFKKMCHSLRTGSTTELCIQDLFALSWVNNSFFEKSKNLWKLIKIEDEIISSNFETIPFILLKILISSGSIKVDARDHTDSTLLMQAAKKNNEKSLRILIEAGADINAENTIKESALVYANKECALALLHAGAHVLPVIRKMFTS